MIGETLGHYSILDLLGAGGMGEVYRAEDESLGREVAIKVLPEEFTASPERLARFEREARVLAALDHPKIAAIYSFEAAEFSAAGEEASRSPTTDNTPQHLTTKRRGFAGRGDCCGQCLKWWLVVV